MGRGLRYRLFLCVLSIIWEGGWIGYLQAVEPYRVEQDDDSFKVKFVQDGIEGRYRGYIYPEAVGYKISFQLDLYKAKLESAQTRLSAIFKTSLGSHGSHEYTTQVYDNAEYLPKKNMIFFREDSRNLAVSCLEIKDGVITGFIQYADGQRKLHLKLIKVDLYDSLEQNFQDFEKINAISRPVLPTLTGEYIADCDGKKTFLQIEAAKWLVASAGVDKPMYGYKLTGRLAEENYRWGDAGQKCLVRSYSDGYFNPYTGRLKLKGTHETSSMFVESGRITFNGCQYNKQSGLNGLTGNTAVRSANSRQQRPVYLGYERDKNMLDFPKTEEIKGSYKGYLYHVIPGFFQRMDLDINLNSLHLGQVRHEATSFTALARLFFSDKNTVEDNDHLTFFFHKNDFTKNLPNMIVDSDMDVQLKIHGWSSNKIEGLWISRRFGISGPFLVERDISRIARPKKTVMDGPVFGLFKGPDWHLKLLPFENQGREEEAVFFPIQIHGNAEIPRLTPRYTIDSCVYDLYTGAIAFELGDGRMVTGSVYPDHMELKWPSRPAWGVQMTTMEPVKFTYAGSGR